MKRIPSASAALSGGILFLLSVAPVGAQTPPPPPAAAGAQETAPPFLEGGMVSHYWSSRPQNPQRFAERTAALSKASAQWGAAQDALKAGHFAAAEAGFRKAIAIRDLPWAHAGLAQALAGQGRTGEALQVYHDLFFELPVRIGCGSADPQEIAAYRARIAQSPTLYSYGSDSFVDWMHYALLLNGAGRWAEAVSIYERALPTLGTDSLPDINVHFDSAVPDAAGLGAAAHLALGKDATNRLDNDTALKEHEQAASLQPDAPLVSYYYGRALRRAHREVEAGVAFQRAAQMGQGDVKKAALDAMR